MNKATMVWVNESKNKFTILHEDDTLWMFQPNVSMMHTIDRSEREQYIKSGTSMTSVNAMLELTRWRKNGES